MAKFPSLIFRLPPSSPPSSGEVEAEGEKQADVCAQNNLLSLPDDLLCKILLNVPAQDIYCRVSRVCRTLYYHTIGSEEFINLHLRQTDQYGLFFRYAPTRNDQHSSPRPVFLSMKQGRVTVSDYYSYESRFTLRSSCSGLILEYDFYTRMSKVHVANPVAGRPFQLPPLPKYAKCMHCCVGCAEASKAYKVVLAYYDEGWDLRRAIFTVGVDKSWRHLATEHLTELMTGNLLVTEGFIHSIFGDTVRTLNVETEVMTEMRAPMSEYAKHKKRYLSTGKSLTLVVEVEHRVFRVWEMVYRDYYYHYWREWERDIVLGSEIQYLFSIQPIGWLQQMEVLVFKGLLFSTWLLLPGKSDGSTPYHPELCTGSQHLLPTTEAFLWT
ncbi:Unknown protein [Striga hermonthica]|uniref:F-box domain-containing protein n=1 Tax=Striga hermonthica TaxID=68872 RepID=A0A9N7MNJ8_STRHE|nr:Unknown protein [Striga hermonthica]